MKHYFTVLMAILFLVVQCGNDVIALDIDKAEQRKNELQQEKEELNKRISDAKKSYSNIESEHNQNLRKLKGIEDEIVARTKEIEKIVAEKRDLINVISEQEANIIENVKILKNTIRDNYIKGEAQEIDVLCAAQGMEDFLDNLTKLSYLSDKVVDLIKETELALSKSKAAKEELDVKEENLVSSRQQLSKTQEEYKNLCEASGQKCKEGLLALGSLNNEKETTERQLDKARNEISAYYANKANQERLQRNFNEAAKNSKSLPKIGGGWYWPTPSSRAITSPFGWRIHPVYNTRRFHSGVDIGASMGSEILAAESGVVELIGNNVNTGYGIYCSIGHGNGRSTLYAHMSTRYVRAGETVKKGQVIGRVGSTGCSTGPHLHFEYMINGECQNPMQLY